MALSLSMSSFCFGPLTHWLLLLLWLQMEEEEEEE